MLFRSRQMAEQDPVLSADQLNGEFHGTLEKMLLEGEYQQKQRVVDELTSRPLSELTAAEREMLQNYRKQ